MSRKLADILGWEEGAVYKYSGKFFKVEQDILLSSLTGKQDEWFLDVSIVLNELTYLLEEAQKVEPKKYYLRHKFLDYPAWAYLNYHYANGKLYLMNRADRCAFKTLFTDSEIEKIEATGFDLRNFEKVGV